MYFCFPWNKGGGLMAGGYFLPQTVTWVPSHYLDSGSSQKEGAKGNPNAP